MAETPRLIITTKPGSKRVDDLTAALTTDWEILAINPPEEPERFDAEVGSVDVIVGGKSRPLPPSNRLKLYHAPFTGYDWITPEELPRGVLFCNTHEHEATIAEHVMLGMLEWQIGLMRDTDPHMRKKSWDGRSISNGPLHRELFGGTVGIVGYGHIGREVARRAKAFGMTVMAVSRTVRDEGDLVDWYGTVDELGHLLGESDFVIVTAPLDDATRGMIAAPQFAQMKDDAVICNVGRGEVIDETALYEALVSRRIRGGIIDVWYDYPSKTTPNPWPSKFPFQKLDNVIMSPHNSAWTEPMGQRRWSFVAANLDRFARGEALENICFEGTGPAARSA